jgi:hypothetical protein
MAFIVVTSNGYASGVGNVSCVLEIEGNTEYSRCTIRDVAGISKASIWNTYGDKLENIKINGCPTEYTTKIMVKRTANSTVHHKNIVWEDCSSGQESFRVYHLNENGMSEAGPSMVVSMLPFDGIYSFPGSLDFGIIRVGGKYYYDIVLYRHAGLLNYSINNIKLIFDNGETYPVVDMSLGLAGLVYRLNPSGSDSVALPLHHFSSGSAHRLRFYVDAKTTGTLKGKLYIEIMGPSSGIPTLVKIPLRGRTHF